MKNHPSLTFVAILLLNASCANLALSVLAAEAPPVKHKPQEELKRARELLARNKSVSAKIVETVSILDHSFKAEGQYLQGNLDQNDHRVRLELKLKVGDTQGTLLEVCDGTILWTRHEIAKEPTITRRNVQQILDAARQNGSVPENVLVADMGLGGMPALLAALERALNFTGLKIDTLRERPVYVIQGSWKPAYLARWQAPPAPGTAPAPLPPYVPDLVRLYLDQETGFPIRVMYLKKIVDRELLKPMLTLDFIDVVLDQPVDQTVFEFKPPDRPPPIEVTPTYLNQLAPGQPLAPPTAPTAPAAPPKAP